MKRRRMILGPVALLALATCAAADTNLFQQGLAAYQAGQFPRAAELFQRTLTADISEGALLNLGLAEWQRGHAGAAVLAWERIVWLQPFQPAARANLRFARRAAQLEAPDLTWYEIASTWLPANAWAWLMTGSLWGTLGLVTCVAIGRFRKSGWHQTLTALGFAVFLLSVPPQLGVLTRARLGVVLEADTPLRLTPTRAAEAAAWLRAGEMVRCRRTRGNYVLIRTSQGAGWVERSRLGLVCGAGASGASNAPAAP